MAFWSTYSSQLPGKSGQKILNTYKKNKKINNRNISIGFKSFTRARIYPHELPHLSSKRKYLQRKLNLSVTYSCGFKAFVWTLTNILFKLAYPLFGYPLIKQFKEWIGNPMEKLRQLGFGKIEKLEIITWKNANVYTRKMRYSSCDIIGVGKI